MRVLAFGPHPDDIEILCAGTLAKYKKQGHDVGVAIMTKGDIGSPTLSREETAILREKEARASAAIIGAEFHWLGCDDEFLYDSPELRLQVIDVLRQFRPDVVLCPDKDNDYHPDHTRTGQIVWDTHVMGPIPLIPTQHKVCDRIHEIWYYDTPGGVNFNPEFYVDITEQWETKLEMARCHESQDTWCKHMYGHGIDYFAEVLGKLRGYQTGCGYAEGFRKARMYPMSVDKNGLLPTAMK